MPLSATEHIHEIVRQNRQQHGAADAASPFKCVGIIGAGRMGTAIAAAHLHAGRAASSPIPGPPWPVVLCDASNEALQNAWNLIADALEMSAADARSCFGSIVRLSDKLPDAARCDLIVESVSETIAVKNDVYSQLRPYLSDDAIIATNTSTIPIGKLASGMADASRFCGLHFCHPVQKRPLVEVVRGEMTGDETTAAAVSHALALGKIPIVVQDGPGFVVNRLLFPYLGEALELLREGASIDAIDRAATEFGMAMGPLRLMDEIGLDTTLQAAWVLWAAFPDRVASSPLLVSMIKAGRLGQKSGAGFYRYRAPMSEDVLGPADAELANIRSRWAHRDSVPSPPVTAERLILPMLLEAFRILAEGKAAGPQDIDLAVLFGLGFPAEKGGLMFWANSLGVDRVQEMLRRLADTNPRLQTPSPFAAWAKTGGYLRTPPA